MNDFSINTVTVGCCKFPQPVVFMLAADTADYCVFRQVLRSMNVTYSNIFCMRARICM